MKFISPIQVPVQVLGVNQTALVLEQFEIANVLTLLIEFSDGFEDFFFLNSDGEVNGTMEKSKEYAKALQNDFGILITLGKTRFYHIFQQVIDGDITNVWIMKGETRAGKISFAVYYNNMYRFELMMENNKWVFVTKSKLDLKIDQQLIASVEDLLNIILS